MFAKEKHEKVSNGHGDNKMEIWRESKGEVGEHRSCEHSVEVPPQCTGHEAPEKAHRNRGDETEKKAKHRYGHSNRRGHGLHLQLHFVEFRYFSLSFFIWVQIEEG